MIGLYFQEFPRHAGRFKSTFSDVELEELREYIINIDKRAFGLTKEQFSTIIYDFAENATFPTDLTQTRRKLDDTLLSGLCGTTFPYESQNRPS